MHPNYFQPIPVLAFIPRKRPSSVYATCLSTHAPTRPRRPAPTLRHSSSTRMNSVCLCLDLEGFHVLPRFHVRKLGWCDHTGRNYGCVHFDPGLRWKTLTPQQRCHVRYVTQHIHGLSFYPETTKKTIQPSPQRVYDRTSQTCTDVTPPQNETSWLTKADEWNVISCKVYASPVWI